MEQAAQVTELLQGKQLHPHGMSQEFPGSLQQRAGSRVPARTRHGQWRHGQELEKHPLLHIPHPKSAEKVSVQEPKGRALWEH